MIEGRCPSCRAYYPIEDHNFDYICPACGESEMLELNKIYNMDCLEGLRMLRSSAGKAHPFKGGMKGRHPCLEC